MKILGLNAYYHDSSAAIIDNGQIICAIEEERLSRKKHDNSFPILSVNKCLEETSLKISDIDLVCYYEKPLLKFERILEGIVKHFPKSYKMFVDAIPEWLNEKIIIEKQIRKKLNYSGKIIFSNHHLSHAAAAFYTSSFEKATVITIDGVGEYQTTVIWRANKNKIISAVDFIFPVIEEWQKVKQLLDEEVYGKLDHISVSWDFLSYDIRNKLSSWKSDVAEGGGALSFYVSHILYYLELYGGVIAKTKSFFSYSQ